MLTKWKSARTSNSIDITDCILSESAIYCNKIQHFYAPLEKSGCRGDLQGGGTHEAKLYCQALPERGHRPDARHRCAGQIQGHCRPEHRRHGLTTDEAIINAAFRDAKAGYTHYGDPKGDPELISAVCKAWEEDFDQSLPRDHVLVSASSCLGMSLAMFAILDPGDEVIVFSPYFALYRAQIELAGGVCVDVPTYAEEDYAISEERLRAAITPRTKAIIFNNPTNPTGMGYDLSTMEMLARVAKEYDLLIAADEIYTTYIYEGDFRPIRTLPGMAERTITLNSFSKNFLMTGWRVGVIIAEPEFLDVMNRINGSLVYSAPSISQRAGIQALEMRKEIREKYVTAYRDRIFYSADRIEKIPYLSLVRPKGTFYLFPGVEKTGLDDKQFCKELLERAHVLVSAGSPFGKTGANHFRIACTVGIDQLKQAFDRMEKLEF